MFYLSAKIDLLSAKTIQKIQEKFYAYQEVQDT